MPLLDIEEEVELSVDDFFLLCLCLAVLSLSAVLLELDVSDAVAPVWLDVSPAEVAPDE